MTLYSVAPDYIPEEIEAAYLEDARRTVSQGLTRGPELPAADDAARLPSPLRRQRVARAQQWLIAAALLGFLGVFAMSALWGWLAVTMGDPVWWGLFSVGSALTVLAALAVAHVCIGAMTAMSPRSPSAAPDRVSGDAPTVRR